MGEGEDEAAGSSRPCPSPAAPPKWAKSVVAKIAPGEDFDVYWQRERERELREAAEDEEVMPRGRR